MGKTRQVAFVRAEEVMQEVAKLCRSFRAKEVILYGSRAKGTAMERSDIDIAVSGVVSLKSWSSKMIKKSLEAYFFYLKEQNCIL